ncbi:MAG: S8 family serine peptidase, partial [Gemmataceae bacterium]|nr:S8 family serine peptidase [Gemmataceae bacterium]
ARSHKDLAGCVKEAVSFLPGQDAEDAHGHGTHCAGVIAGPEKPEAGPRYGVAPAAELYVARVLDRTGRGREGQVLQGLDWALAQGCLVVAMPFGAPPLGNLQAFHEEVGERARRKHNALLFAAAGGHSNRQVQNVQPVAVPASTVSVIGLGAVRQNLQVANFSNGGRPRGAGSVDLVGPGINIRSAWMEPMTYHVISGTSCATAFAAGIAALVAEALGPDASAGQVLARMLMGARPLDQASRDVGKGLVQAI